MESSVLERGASSETADKPPPKRTFADQLRRLADWIEAREVTDDEIVCAGIGVACRAPEITLRGHELIKQEFPGHKATAQRMQNFDELRLVEDGIHFRAWQSRKDQPASESDVIL